MLVNHIRPTILSAAIVSRYTRFWPKEHRELPFLAIANKFSCSRRVTRRQVGRHFTRTNVTYQCETVYETFLFHIASNLDRLRLCLPIHNQRSQHQSGQNTLQSVYQGHTSILRFIMEVLSWCSWRTSQHPPVQGLVLPSKRFQISLFAPCILVSRQGFSRPTPPRPTHLPILKRIWCLLTDSTSSDVITLKTVWFVDSTGSTPPSTSIGYTVNG